MKLDIKNFSDQYIVKELDEKDVLDIYELCSKNSLYYQYCPPFVSKQSIINDMNALPKNKSKDDKYYVGYFKSDKLIALLDLIYAYPNDEITFIGFFMMNIDFQKQGIGSQIIEDLCNYLKTIGLKSVRLAWVEGNPQPEHFWHKNKFVETGITSKEEYYTVIIAERIL